jgi:DnaJ-domain-containing protein 1
MVGPGGSLTACLVRPLFQQENNNYSNKATITTTIAELFSKCQKWCKTKRIGNNTEFIAKLKHHIETIAENFETIKNTRSVI